MEGGKSKGGSWLDDEVVDTEAARQRPWWLDITDSQLAACIHDNSNSHYDNDSEPLTAPRQMALLKSVERSLQIEFNTDSDAHSNCIDGVEYGSQNSHFRRQPNHALFQPEQLPTGAESRGSSVNMNTKPIIGSGSGRSSLNVNLTTGANAAPNLRQRPVFELLCRLYHDVEPEKMETFVTLVENAAPDKSRHQDIHHGHGHRQRDLSYDNAQGIFLKTFRERALQNFPPPTSTVTVTAKQKDHSINIRQRQLKARCGLLCASGTPLLAMRFYLRDGNFGAAAQTIIEYIQKGEDEKRRQRSSPHAKQILQMQGFEELLSYAVRTLKPMGSDGELEIASTIAIADPEEIPNPRMTLEKAIETIVVLCPVNYTWQALLHLLDQVSTTGDLPTHRAKIVLDSFGFLLDRSI